MTPRDQKPAPAEPRADTRPGVATVGRAVDILSAVADSAVGLTTAEVSELLGLDRSTAHRLLATLRSAGMVHRVGTPGRFLIGETVRRLAWGTSADLRAMVGATLAQLVELTGESASFSILRHDRFLCVAHRSAPHELNYTPRSGTDYPLNSGAAGLAIWAALPVTDREGLLELAFPAFTDATVTDPDLLRAELDRTVARGYAVSAGVRSPGGCSIACAVSGGRNSVAGALAVSAAEARMPLAQLVGFVGQVRAAADRLSTDMGWTPAG